MNKLVDHAIVHTHQLCVCECVLVVIHDRHHLPKRQANRYILQHEGESLHVLDDDLTRAVVMLHEQIHRLVSGHAVVVDDVAIVAILLEEHVPINFVYNRQ